MRNDMIVIEIASADGGDVLINPMLVSSIAANIDALVYDILTAEAPELGAFRPQTLLAAVNPGSIKLGFVPRIAGPGSDVDYDKLLTRLGGLATLLGAIGGAIIYAGDKLGYTEPPTPERPSVVIHNPVVMEIGDRAIGRPSVDRLLDQLVTTTTSEGTYTATISAADAPERRLITKGSLDPRHIGSRAQPLPPGSLGKVRGSLILREMSPIEGTLRGREVRLLLGALRLPVPENSEGKPNSGQPSGPKEQVVTVLVDWQVRSRSPGANEEVEVQGELGPIKGGDLLTMTAPRELRVVQGFLTVTAVRDWAE